ncbi:MAG TPA: amino acid adenylation domain-containing protein, partial [Thermoanaerobaculia bacterium]|nr:amino acid adenylation domain-containing protein [Thermoanaerobaculia bacterium]
ITAAEAARPFDLSQPPLLRAALLRLGEREHRLLLTLHHIVSDGWSQAILLSELTVLYEAFAVGRLSPLPEPAFQYADFAAWQQRWLSGETLERQLAAWRRRLAGAPDVLDLPADRPRPAVRSARGGHVDVEIPAVVARAADRLARREGATPFMLLLAAFDALLYRYTRQDTILVGSPIAGRNRSETERLIGFFVNTLVLRVDVGKAASFRDLLERTREVTLDAYEHQDLPFEKLVEELRPERNLSHTPLFQVMLVVQNLPAVRSEISGLALESLEVDNRTSKFDLSLGLAPREDGIAGSIEYSADLFDAPTAQRIAGHFRTLLAGAVADPGARLGDLPLLTAAERDQILVDWNERGTAPAADLCLHELFAAQAARTPDAVAVIDAAERVTYGELDRISNLVAHRLRELGVGPEVFVGVLLDRSVDLVASLLGILKAGGAYVPLDPAYPRQRIDFMLEDSGARVLLTPSVLAGWRSGTAAPPPPGLAAPGNLAYVIYTSGSTGRPKGVAIEHRSAVAFALWAREVFPAEELSGVLASTSVCFDLSVFELFVPLAWGGRVVLADNALHLASHPAAGEVRLVNTVPSAIAELVRMGAIPPSVLTVNLAGEPLKNALVQEIYGRGTIERVLNLYGPSEDTTYSTFTLAARGSGKEPTIGRPIVGTRLYLLDPEGSPVPVGVPGGLYLGGAGLARGYFGRPDLTAERFVPDPFSGKAGDRLYFTGDLARYGPTGEIEFLGRLDHQVKVRGFRIELGEIESALAAHPAVREAVVIARAGTLVAYVVADPAPAASSLRSFLKERLPEHMVPTAWVFLAALPLTPNGKVDRKALPEPGDGARKEAPAGPRTPAEEVLAGIWADVLGLAAVGPDDNFFELGGHSLLAARVVSRIREAFGVELPLRRLFEAPTVAELAAGLAPGGAEPLPRIEPAPRSGPLPLSFSQRRLWFLDRLEPGSALYNIPAPLRIEGALDAGRLARALGEVIRRHESLRTTFPAIDGDPRQVVAEPADAVLPVIDLRGLPEEVRRQVEAEARRPFDLAAGPLLRTTLLRTGEEEHVLLLTLHHIVADAWSLDVLLRELFALYEGASLPEPVLQIADVAVWQQRWLSGEALEERLAFWRERLEPAPEPLPLPADHPRPAVPTHRGALLSRPLSPELSAGLRALGRREGVTPFMLALAALDTLLLRYTGQEDLAVGTAVANRNRAETEGLIGFFVNTLVLRASLAGDPPFRSLLKTVRETALAASAHQDLPFDLLVEELRPERHLSRTPFFQVMLNVYAARHESVQPRGLRISALGVDTGTAKFDLTLTVLDAEPALALSLEFAADLFETPTAARLLGHLETLLAGAVAAPGTHLSDLALLTAAELHQTALAWNDTRALYPREAAIHDLFAEWVEKTPEAVAVVSGDASLTYRELDARSSRLARHLRSLGVGPETLVALAAERSPELIVAILGVLKAGGAYVPLDPESPRERLAWLLADTGAPVLLAQPHLLDRLPESSARTVLLSPDEIEGGEDLSLPRVAADQLAYVMYTSGTTGRPKGVAVPQRAVARLVRETGYARFGPDEVFLLLAPVSFD